jgi:biopolymer transport protein ExbD
MNAAQVRAKARMAVKRREERIEQEEIEGGELNLVPYLDIVTNLMLFLLSLAVSGMALGQLDTTLPDHIKAATPTQPKPPDKDPQLQLVVSVTQKNILIWSISGLEGTLEAPKAVIPRTGETTNEGELGYAYHKLNEALLEIAARRWRGQMRDPDTYEVILQADGDIPYATIIHIMDHLRRKLPEAGAPQTPVAMPKMGGEGAARKVVEAYDPDKHYLFPDILFSSGFD